ncbi:hypothetical protein TNCV_1822581 [Trichonephila clavipes]|uniref:Uncharacterized protein n=1 Tax=Trichonephila clavipes TaxID=2585209 RepID=A0A8X6S9W1_TRICX|nr:hypothetical protein TNCV_1822581 [Trichonephila clavipes]
MKAIEPSAVESTFRGIQLDYDSEALLLVLYEGILKVNIPVKISKYYQPLSRKSSGEVGGRGREMGGPDHPQGILLQNWGGTELNRTVTCIVLIAKANDRRKKSCL